MPTIDVSQNLHKAALGTMFYFNSGGISGAYNDFYGALWFATNSYMGIYKGTQQTTYTLDNNTRDGDRLIAWNFTQLIGTGWEYNMTPSTINSNNDQVNLKSFYTTASQSGTATWFRIVWMNGANAGATFWSTNDIMGAITGTVGPLGSGADLEMAGFTNPSPVNIVAGQRYKIDNLQLTFPRTFTY